jgi:hypothetical protein
MPDDPYDSNPYEFKALPGVFLIDEETQLVITIRQFQAIIEGIEAFCPRMLFRYSSQLLRAKELLRNNRFGELGCLLNQLIEEYKGDDQEREYLAEIMLNAKSLGICLVNQSPVG